MALPLFEPEGKHLCLANGDIIKLTGTADYSLKFILECESLAKASPQMISRVMLFNVG